MNGWLIPVEYLKVVITWPVVLLVGLLMFRAQLVELLGRIKSAEGPLGLKIDTEIREQLKEPLLPLPTSTDTPADLQATEKMAADLAQNLTRNFEDPTLLQLSPMGRLSVAVAFERTFSILFAVQIDLLRHLRERHRSGLQWVSDVEMERFKAAVHPHVTAPVTEYAEILVASHLVALDGCSFALTDVGEAFLTYVDRSGLKKIASIL